MSCGKLTPRQHELLIWVSEGLGYKGAAEKMGVKIGTIKSHMREIVMKLDAKNVTHAAAMVARAKREEKEAKKKADLDREMNAS